MERVICPYCNAQADLVTGTVVYPHRPDLADKKIYRCRPCGAYVGCHPGTEKPLGRLANAELRRWKVRAHSAFDPLWKEKRRREGCSKTKARSAAYKWLAGELGIDPAECHIGMFTVEQCQAVVEICSDVYAQS